MADRHKAKMDHDWNLQSHLMALLANINRDSKVKPTPFAPDDFNPFKHQQEVEKPKEDDLQERLERLKKLFPDGK
jgi:hypothetical protein